MKKKQRAKNKLTQLDKAFTKCRSLLILMHDYPDPDAIASALLLSYLAHKRYGLRTAIAHGGLITRAENRAMVQQLKLKLTHVDDVKWRRYPCIAVVDTQPGFGNNSLPNKVKPTIVFDHHPIKETSQAAFTDIRTDYGASTTILLDYLEAAELEIPVDVATAVAYAIRSETQDLGRDASPADIEAYLSVYPKANKRILAKIFNPMLPKAYFILIHTALEKAKVYRHLTHVHLGKLESAEFVSLAADFLLQHERITWSIVTGRYQGVLFISLRSSHPTAHAGKLLKQIIGRRGSGGGHPMVAGGRIPIKMDKDEVWKKMENIIIERFLHKLGFHNMVKWKPMLFNSESPENGS